MSALLRKLSAGPVLALLTAATYRASLVVLGGTAADDNVRWGLALTCFAGLVAWAHVFRRTGGAP